jgi:hypothetical protein
LVNDPLARKSYFGENFLSNDIRAKESFKTYAEDSEEEEMQESETE